MVVVVVRRCRLLLLINHTPDMTELLNMARDIDRTFLIEPVLLLRFVQQLREQRVVHITNRNNKALLLRPLPHRNRDGSFRNTPRLPPPASVVVEPNLRHV